MEGRIVIFHSSEWLFYPNFCGQFFLDLPFDGLFRCFPGLDLTARKLPAIFEFSVSPLGSEDFVLVDDQCSHNVDCFQCGLPFSPYLHYILLYHGNYVNFRKTKKARAGTPTTDHLPCRTLSNEVIFMTTFLEPAASSLMVGVRTHPPAMRLVPLPLQGRTITCRAIPVRHGRRREGNGSCSRM